MKIGTKSVLIGAHQFVIHTITVLLAWIELYGLPNWKELICICIHDLGYWDCNDIDGKDGKRHSEFGARIAQRLFDDSIDANRFVILSPSFEINGWHRVIMGDNRYSDLCLFHSREYSQIWGVLPSKLCWADKLSVKYDPWWLYLPRVILSGEIKEFRDLAEKFGEVPATASNKEWYKWAQERMIRKAYTKDIRPAYTKGS